MSSIMSEETQWFIKGYQAAEEGHPYEPIPQDVPEEMQEHWQDGWNEGNEVKTGNQGQ